ncbi:MAG: T9SS type A sorting domain-containing protein [Bacteroidetes bacterium]|nr:T9SS type A sorting domain-containing protein [Bacteroidota bacterium]
MKPTITLIFSTLVLLTISFKPIQAQSPTATGELTLMEELGKALFFDKIADPDNMSCADCHAPEVGFTGPVPGINKKGSVYRGAVPQRFGNRKPPSAAYATLSPVFYYDDAEGLFVGGNFWDGRATGEHLGNPAADQALGPFLNPVEQNNASKQAVLEQIASSTYVWMWELVWGEPLSFTTNTEIELNYDRVGLAIAEYENSSEVNQFSSKFDYYLQGLVDLTEEEEWGLDLFNDEEKGKCALCHISEPGPDGTPPLFTDFTFDNLGTPKNPDNPFYNMNKVYLSNGSPINPIGADWIDYGLGGFLANHPDPAWQAMAGENMGKHKVPTLRNVDKKPGNNFTKAYMHNGVFKTLKEVVHFYNTRDVGMWPPPEVSANVNDDELGDLGLTDEEEDAIVAFMKTLSDGYNLPKSAAISGSTPELLKTQLLIGPNPFQNNTSLTVTLSQSSNINILVFSLNGSKVKEVYNGFVDKGESSFTLNARGLDQGVYIVCVEFNGQRISKKITLIN